MKKTHVPILVGNRTYSLVTSMSDERLQKVSELLADVMAKTDPRLDQDERLFLAAMTIASSLHNIKEQLDTALKDV